MPQDTKGQFGPSKPSMRSHEPSIGVLAFVMMSVMIIVLTWSLHLGKFLLTLEVVLFVLGFVRYRRGRGYYKLIKKFEGLAIMANDNEVIGPRTPEEYPAITTGVRLPDDEDGNLLGTMVDGRYDHVVFYGNGLKALGESTSAVERADYQAANSYKKWDALTKLSVGVTSTTRWRNWVKTERNWFIRQNVLPEVIDAFNYIEVPDEELTNHERRWKRKAMHLMTRRDVNRLYANRTTQAYVISARRPLSWGSSLKESRHLSPDDIRQSAIVTLANRVVEDLDDIGVVEPRYLNLCGVLDFFAEGWMTGPDFEEYHNRREHGEIPMKDSDLRIGERGELLDNSLFWFKKQPKVGHDWICFDGTNYHRIYQITRLSPYLRVNTMNLIKRFGFTGSMTVVGETMSGEQEARYTSRSIALREQIRRSRRERVYERHEEREKIEELKRRDEARYTSGDTVMGYNAYLAVGASTIKQLDAFGNELEIKVRRTPYAKITPVLGEEYQEDAFITAVLGVNRL